MIYTQSLNKKQNQLITISKKDSHTWRKSMNQKPFSNKEKMIFAWGDVFGGGSQAMIGVLYLIFLTDIIGINPALAATAILISKFWDAISDPLMGVISD